jgi:hypothetical protein
VKVLVTSRDRNIGDNTPWRILRRYFLGSHCSLQPINAACTCPIGTSTITRVSLVLRCMRAAFDGSRWQANVSCVMCHVSAESLVTESTKHNAVSNCKTETREVSAKWWCCFQLYKVRQANFLFWTLVQYEKRKLACRTTAAWIDMSQTILLNQESSIDGKSSYKSELGLFSSELRFSFRPDFFWSKSKSKLHYDRQSVGQSVLVSGTHLGLATNFSLSLFDYF